MDKAKISQAIQEARRAFLAFGLPAPQEITLDRRTFDTFALQAGNVVSYADKPPASVQYAGITIKRGEWIE